ncbi:MAG: hypothetical protein ACR2Q4_10025, partial [Geminicoccaceae bacterium]
PQNAITKKIIHIKIGLFLYVISSCFICLLNNYFKLISLSRKMGLLQGVIALMRRSIDGHDHCIISACYHHVSSSFDGRPRQIASEMLQEPPLMAAKQEKLSRSRGISWWCDQGE